MLGHSGCQSPCGDLVVGRHGSHCAIDGSTRWSHIWHGRRRHRTTLGTHPNTRSGIHGPLHPRLGHSAGSLWSISSCQDCRLGIRTGPCRLFERVRIHPIAIAGIRVSRCQGNRSTRTVHLHGITVFFHRSNTTAFYESNSILVGRSRGSYRRRFHSKAASGDTILHCRRRHILGRPFLLTPLGTSRSIAKAARFSYGIKACHACGHIYNNHCTCGNIIVRQGGR
mmetsp:Transcript_4800/g.8955  ORF Transcript_4800/g.8955 Transcript_4800/m.8955 type:complete len:225 (+) Transcript_4800:422-1096(+)